MKSMLKKKGYGAGRIVVFAIAAFLAPACGHAKAELTKAKNECVACHTDLNTMIRLSSEIKQIRPASGKSAEASGEG
jgi:hypothetical protein